MNTYQHYKRKAQRLYALAQILRRAETDAQRGVTYADTVEIEPGVHLTIRNDGTWRIRRD